MADPNTAFYNFSQLYGSDELSDLTIVLTTASEDAPAKPPPAKRARTAKQRTPSAADAAPSEGEEVLLPGHAVILAGCSPVFMAQLTRWKEQAGKASNDKPRITLHVSSPAELDAARAMIQFMYQRRLPDDAPQQQLVTMLQLADKYDVQPCAVACGIALSTLQLEQGTLHQVLLLPPSYSESPLFSSLFSKVADQLQQEFGDLEVAWADEEKKRQFLALPLKGVELLLDDQRTRVKYENTVLVAVTVWVHQHSGSLTAEEKQRLAQLIRCPFFTPFFASTVAMVTPWFVAALGMTTVAVGQSIAHVMGIDGGPQLATIVSVSAGWPASWARGRRPISARRQLLLEWNVSLQQLEAVFTDEDNEEAELLSPSAFFGGYMWSLELVGCDGSAGATLGVYLRPDMCSDMHHWRQQPTQAVVVARAASVSCPGTGRNIVKKFDRGDSPTCLGQAYGYADFWRTGGMSAWDVTKFAQWADANGQLLLQLRVSNLL